MKTKKKPQRTFLAIVIDPKLKKEFKAAVRRRGKASPHRTQPTVQDALTDLILKYLAEETAA